METVLGISLGTRLLGLAIISDGELLKWQTYYFPQKWNSRKRENILKVIDKWIVKYKVYSVGVKIPDVLPTSKPFMQLVGGINIITDQLGAKAIYLNLSKIKQFYYQDEPSNKHKLLSKVTKSFPELERYDIKLTSFRSQYCSKFIEAIAVAHILQNEA